MLPQPEATRTASEKYAAKIEKLNRLLAAGAIDQEIYARAVAKARAEMEAREKTTLAKAADLGSEVRRAINSEVKDVSDASKVAERFVGDPAPSGSSLLTCSAVRPGSMRARICGPTTCRPSLSAASAY